MRIQQSQIRRGIVATLAGVFAVPVLWAVTPLTADAAINCVVSAGVLQTGSVVTGTPGNDTIDCWGLSPAWPAVSRIRIGLSRPSTARWILVLSPPRDRPRFSPSTARA
jgi:hypothetical protein